MPDAMMWVVVLVASGEANEPTTRAMTRAMADALGANANVAVRETSGPPSDADAANFERKDHADAVVELVWTEAHHRRASLRTHLAQSRRWVERTIAFKASDADTERGRTLGFAAASTLPENEAAPAEGDAGPPSRPPGATSPNGGQGPAAASSSGPGAASGGATATSSTPTSSTAPTATEPGPRPDEAATGTGRGDAGPAPTSNKGASATGRPPTEATQTGAASSRPGAASDATAPSASPAGSSTAPEADTNESLGVDLVAAGTLDGPSSGVGPEIAVQAFAFGRNARWLAVRAAAVVLFGKTQANPVAGAPTPDAFTWTSAQGSLGLVWSPWRASLAHPFGASLRTEAWAALTWVHAPSNWLRVPSGQRANGGPELAVEGTWRFAGPFEALAAAGLGFAVFHAEVDVAGSAAARIGPWRPFAELGLRAVF